MEQKAFQDMIPDNYCYGCGPENPRGLHLKSTWDGEQSVASFSPQSHHAAGPRHVLNGGVIATIIDCHCICTAIADAYRREGRAVGGDPPIWYATGSLRVDYLRPTPIDEAVTLRAEVLEAGPKKTVLACTLTAAGKECARGEVVAVRVPETWKSGR
ncbi:MAG: PaaI family thioesterase [Syntrophotaleaceae bacterium]